MVDRGDAGSVCEWVCRPDIDNINNLGVAWIRREERGRRVAGPDEDGVGESWPDVVSEFVDAPHIRDGINKTVRPCGSDVL